MIHNNRNHLKINIISIRATLLLGTFDLNCQTQSSDKCHLETPFSTDNYTQYENRKKIESERVSENILHLFDLTRQ